jgi:hypothetical protein
VDNDERHRAYLADCCVAFGLELHEVLGKHKTRADTPVTRARKAIAWALRVRFQDISYPMIGRILHRDHSTIMWAVDTFKAALEGNEGWAVELSGRLFGPAHPRLVGLESPLDSLRSCSAVIDLSGAVDMPLEAVGA